MVGTSESLVPAIFKKKKTSSESSVHVATHSLLGFLLAYPSGLPFQAGGRHDNIEPHEEACEFRLDRSTRKSDFLLTYSFVLSRFFVKLLCIYVPPNSLPGHRFARPTPSNKMARWELARIRRPLAYSARMQAVLIVFLFFSTFASSRPPPPDGPPSRGGGRFPATGLEVRKTLAQQERIP